MSEHSNTTILTIQQKSGFVTEHNMLPVTITPVQVHTHTPTQIALVGVLFAVGTLSQVILPNNHRCHRNSDETDPVVTEMRALFGYYGRVGADIGHV